MNTEVGIDAFSARERPGLAFCERLAMTREILAGRVGGFEVVASISAWRFVPVPDIRTKMLGRGEAIGGGEVIDQSSYFMEKDFSGAGRETVS